MQRQQNRTRKCVHVITDLAHVGEKERDGKRRGRKKEREGECKTSTSEIMYIKKDSTRKTFKKQTWGV